MFYDYQDDVVIGTLAARLFLARSRNYRRNRDQYPYIALQLPVLGLNYLCAP